MDALTRVNREEFMKFSDIPKTTSADPSLWDIEYFRMPSYRDPMEEPCTRCGAKFKYHYVGVRNSCPSERTPLWFWFE